MPSANVVPSRRARQYRVWAAALGRLVVIVAAMFAVGGRSRGSARGAALYATDDGAKLQAARPARSCSSSTSACRLRHRAIRVCNSAAERVDEGNAGPGSQPSILRVSLRDGLPDGPCIVTCRAISGDRHPTFVFTVRNAEAFLRRSQSTTLLGGLVVLALVLRWRRRADNALEGPGWSHASQPWTAVRALTSAAHG